MVAKIGEALWEKRRYGQQSTKAPNLKYTHFLKNGFCVRLIADTNMPQL